MIDKWSHKVNFHLFCEGKNFGVGTGINKLNEHLKSYEYSFFLEGDWITLPESISGHNKNWLMDCLDLLETDDEVDQIQLRRFQHDVDDRQFGFGHWIKPSNIKKQTDKFLFLNGRGRRHRKQLISRLTNLLPESIWSNLDSTAGTVQLLDPKYEFEFYQNNTSVPQSGYVKYKLFNNDWGEIYLNPQPYLDTYFSLITETVFEYPYSFRTEKLWKPVAIGHPFIVASSYGYYRDLHKLGFRTFGHLIDESFDLVDNNQQRLEHIACVVEHLCKQDLSAFITAAEETCKYNQEHLAELRLQVRKEFPQRFIKFINERS
jgi:hypothetical protein